MSVKILRWPSESVTRERLRVEKVPRVLVVEDGDLPPANGDVLEDWVRAPISPTELRERANALAIVALSGVPHLTTEGVLSFGGRAIPLPPAGAEVMRVLLSHFQNLTPREELVRKIWPNAAPSRNTVDLRILRLRRRIAPLGLLLRTVVGRGFLLDVRDGTARLMG